MKLLSLFRVGLLIFMCVLFLTPTNAIGTLIPGGSFEEADWNTAYWTSVLYKNVRGDEFAKRTNAPDANFPTNGNWYASLRATEVAEGFGDPPYAQITTKQFFQYKKIFVDFKIARNSACNISDCRVRIDLINDQNQIVSTPYNVTQTNATKIDFNFDTGSTPVRIRFRVSADGLFSSIAIYDMNIDNLRAVDNPSQLCSGLPGTPNCPGSNCQSIIYNGNTANKIDIVFIGSGYPDKNKFVSAINFVIDYDGDENGLFSFEPYKTYRDRFNIWMVDAYNTYQMIKAPTRWIFKDDILQAAKSACNFGNEWEIISYYPRFGAYSSYDLNHFELSHIPKHVSYTGLGCEVSGQCTFPYDFNHVDPYSAGCQGGNNANCYSDALNSSEKQRVFVHEFGHSFGGLFDEYQIGGNANIISYQIANCDHNNMCPKWSSIGGTSCNPLCGYTNWYRPYNQTVMGAVFNNPRHEYGQVSVNRLIDIITNYLLYETILPLYGLILSLNSNNGVLNEIGGQAIPTLATEIADPGDASYIGRIENSDGNILFDFNLSIPSGYNTEGYGLLDGNNTFIGDVNNLQLLNDFNFTMSIPYLDNASKFKIYDRNQNLLITIGLLKYIYRSETFVGYGGNTISGQNYKLTYFITGQPTSKLDSNNYSVVLGQR